MALAAKSVRKRQTERGPVSNQSRGEAMAQVIKSEQTRARLIDATVRCLVRHGYAETTTLLVANEAGLSRGAMLHHFENGMALIEAVIGELHERRLRGLHRAAQNAGHDARSQVRIYWRQVQRPAFIAIQELQTVARTNRGLARVLHPLQREFQEKYRAEAAVLYPEWKSDPKAFEAALLLTQTVVEGLARRLTEQSIDAGAVEDMLANLERQVDALNPAITNTGVS